MSSSWVTSDKVLVNHYHQHLVTQLIIKEDEVEDSKQSGIIGENQAQPFGSSRRQPRSTGCCAKECDTMYVSPLLDKEGGMYGGPARCSSSGSSSSGSSSGLPGQSFAPAPPYPEYMGYHVGALDAAGPPPGPWGSHYPAQQREDWPAFGPGPGPAQLSAPAPQGSYGPAEYSAPQPAQPGPHSPARHGAFDWMRRAAPATAAGKTRTKEKYRVVYTDHQRLELEKEFHCNRYITIRRKSELAANLGLSERQVKIWFQNRRAKERKLLKKKLSQFDGSGGSAHSDSGSLSPNELPGSLFPPPHGISALQPSDIHQVMVSE